MGKLALKKGSRVTVKQFETPMLDQLFLRKVVGKTLKNNKPPQPSHTDQAVIISVTKDNSKKSYKAISIKLLDDKGKPKGELIDLGYFNNDRWRFLFDDPLSHVRCYSERGPYYTVELAS